MNAPGTRENMSDRSIYYEATFMCFSKRLVLTLPLVGGLLFGQAASPTAGQIVRLNVRALDSSGVPIKDLTPKDFKVSDQGKEQSVLFMRGNDDASTGSLAPGEYSNRPAGVAPHSIVLLFDLLNESQSDRTDVWHQLRRTLPQMESGQSVYFYLLTLEGNLLPIQAIDPKNAPDAAWPKQAGEKLDEAMKSANHSRPVGMGDETVVKKTYVALETLANEMAGLPGPRDIVWITNGVPNVWNPKGTCNGDYIDCALYIPHLAVTLAQDGVAVDPLSYAPSPNSRRDMDMLAGLTGGRTFAEQDAPVVISAVGREAVGSYTLFYEPGADNWDGKFHKVRVSVEGKAAKVSGGDRYYAMADARTVTAREQAVLISTFQRPLDTPDIALKASVTAAAGQKVHLQILVDPASLLLHQTADQFVGNLTLVIADMGANGALGAPTMMNFDAKLTEQQLDSVRKTGIPMGQDHELKAGAQKIRIILLDQSTNLAGSLTFPAKS